jgi:hypothetical protein
MGRAPEPLAAAVGGSDSGRGGVESRPSRERVEARVERASRDGREGEGFETATTTAAYKGGS